MKPKVVVMTCDKYLWAVRCFAHLFNRYWSSDWPVVVGGFTAPDFPLPANFSFHSIGRMEDYPVQKWSDAAIKLLSEMGDDSHVVLMLEDYWLCRPVDVRAVETLSEYAASQENVLRVDLTADRFHLNKSAMRHAATLNGLPIYQSPPSPYQMSVMAGTWNRKRLLDVLLPGLNPWEVEVALTDRVNKMPALRVMASDGWPVKYVLAFRGGDPGKFGNFACFGSDYRLSDSDLGELRENGYMRV